ncbi:uncharacterized protein LOC109815931 isoform X2 [Cajanus cajan]|uniref:uncharacterized protein LOC109815931 isoform X2 n=1 Tax=Cajanus cajan TaxID=3821 RepID=UPI0010FB9B6A|nr:uncharacterized protein LOC109815931 isoform X2 [Cajanus cajan]
MLKSHDRYFCNLPACYGYWSISRTLQKGGMRTRITKFGPKTLCIIIQIFQFSTTRSILVAQLSAFGSKHQQQFKGGGSSSNVNDTMNVCPQPFLRNHVIDGSVTRNRRFNNMFRDGHEQGHGHGPGPTFGFF